MGHDGPLVVAHRGACAYRPEHTLAAYELAVELGADFIEPDLVPTQDGVLVARHENEIGRTTDVEQHPEFADRQVTKVIDGRRVSGWFTEDFTLAELRTLRATERVPQLRPDNTAYDGLFQVPTLPEIIDLAKRHEVGLYPETKHPTYFEGIGLGLEEPLVEALESAGFRGHRALVFIQSFETGNLRKLSELTELPLVQLIHHEGQPYDLQALSDPRTYRDLVSADGLADIAGYASAIGVSKELVVARDPDERLGQPSELVAAAHGAGLQVHAYTFRPEKQFLPADLREQSDEEAEVRPFLLAGVDGVIADSPDAAVAARTRLLGPERDRC
ncbi:MAG: glycerophosphodiester phosphodiesterase [Actinomycetota bacterium]|nr:glycerophosphodiester phosphodiesterase [Actinomycetota bacterium]